MLLMTIVDSLLGVASVCKIKQKKILGERHLPNLATSTLVLEFHKQTKTWYEDLYSLKSIL